MTVADQIWDGVARDAPVQDLTFFNSTNTSKFQSHPEFADPKRVCLLEVELDIPPGYWILGRIYWMSVNIWVNSELPMDIVGLSGVMSGVTWARGQYIRIIEISKTVKVLVLNWLCRSAVDALRLYIQATWTHLLPEGAATAWTSFMGASYQLAAARGLPRP